MQLRVWKVGNEMIKDKLSIKLDRSDFPNPSLPQLWVKTEQAIVSVIISARGIEFTSWISKKHWPTTKTTKHTLRF